VYNADMFSVSV